MLIRRAGRLVIKGAICIQQDAVRRELGAFPRQMPICRSVSSFRDLVTYALFPPSCPYSVRVESVAPPALAPLLVLVGRVRGTAYPFVGAKHSPRRAFACMCISPSYGFGSVDARIRREASRFPHSEFPDGKTGQYKHPCMYWRVVFTFSKPQTSIAHLCYIWDRERDGLTTVRRAQR